MKLFLLYFAEIFTVMRNKAPNLDRVLKEALQENFIDSAMLLTMVNGGDPRTVSRLILLEQQLLILL